jgi:hypothetical protein
VYPPGGIAFFHGLMQRGVYTGEIPLTLDAAVAALEGLIENRRHE